MEEQELVSGCMESRNWGCFVLHLSLRERASFLVVAHMVFIGFQIEIFLLHKSNLGNVPGGCMGRECVLRDVTESRLRD